MAKCTPPPYVDKCPPVQVWAEMGVQYIAFLRCDAANETEVLVVYELCAGKPSGAPTIVNALTGADHTPVGVIRNCGSGPDIEQNVFCDQAVDPPKPFISRVLFDADGNIIPDNTGTFELDGTTTYTPVGPVAVCGGDIVDTELVGPLCEKDAAGKLVGYAWSKVQYRGVALLPNSVLVGYKLANPTTWLEPYTLTGSNTFEPCAAGTQKPCNTCR